VLLLDNDGNGQSLANSAHVAALLFAGDAHDLLLTDNSANTLSLIQGLPDAPIATVLADSNAGISGPVGLNISSKGNIVVANGGDADVLVLDPTGAPIGTYPCLVAPTGLSRLNGSAVFLLNVISNNDPLWLFDGDTDTPRVMFVPVDAVDPQGTGQ
jgi:DNA-binding beta-propeller fold protein YncE